jgi:hypothetical protein
MSNYVQRVIDRLAEEFPTCEFDLLRFYSLLVLTKGTQTTLADVHDAWGCWRAVTRPGHEKLVEFEKLTPLDAERDLKYVVAIRNLAAELQLDTSA